MVFRRVRSTIVLVLVYCLVLGDGAKRRLDLSREEDGELERQLKILNKPAIKTIKNKYGDVIDCVDINKQPSFDHPLLRNHKVQSRPSSLCDTKNEGYIPKAGISFAKLSSAGCPFGSIPIKRTTKEDLIRLKSLTTKSAGNFSANFHQLDSNTGFHAMAVEHEGSYHGAAAWLSMYGISSVAKDQYTGVAVIVLNGQTGPSADYNIISVAASTDGFQHVTCYNQLCHGFVQTSKTYIPGAIVTGLGQNTFLPISIRKDNVTGDWWFSVTIGTEEQWVGYWPRAIFTSLSHQASMIQYGGIAYSPAGESSPPMGNGLFPSDGGASVARIHIVDQNNQIQDPKGDEILYIDRPDCYKVSPLINNGDSHQWHFSYGGPGRCLN